MDSCKPVVTQTAQVKLSRYKIKQKDMNVRVRFAEREKGYSEVGGRFF